MTPQKNQKDLETENKLLKKKLENLETWMKTSFERNKIQIDNQQEHIENLKKEIHLFLGAESQVQLPQGCLEEILTSEVSYSLFEVNQELDGESVMIGYSKALDMIIEEIITKPFREFFKEGEVFTSKDFSPLERSLYLIIHRGFTLSFGRLFGLLHDIKHKKTSGAFEKRFKDFLLSRHLMKEILLGEDFYGMMREVIYSEVLGEKRHRGIVHFEEVKKMRNILIGNLKDKNCIFREIIKIESVPF